MFGGSNAFSRINKLQFINYSDYHVPFTEFDVVQMEAMRSLPSKVKHRFVHGEGMHDLLNDDTVEQLVKHSSFTNAEDEATLHFTSFVAADEGTKLNGEDIYNIIQEAKAKGVSIASLLHKLHNSNTRVLVTPADGVVELAIRLDFVGILKRCYDFYQSSKAFIPPLFLPIQLLL